MVLADVGTRFVATALAEPGCRPCGAGDGGDEGNGEEFCGGGMVKLGRGAFSVGLVEDMTESGVPS